MKSQPSPTLTNIQVKSTTRATPNDLEMQVPLSPYQGVYSKEALEAVGLGYSPTLIQTSSPINIQAKINENIKFDQYRLQQQAAAERFEASISSSPQMQDLQPRVHKRAVELLPPPPPKAIIPPTPVEVIDFNVIRCWDLQDCLGGTNPYVLVNIPSFGKASTPCVYNSNQPYFGCILSLNYPLKRSGKEALDDDDLVNYDEVDSTVVQVFVYNKNHSISDEMIAFGERDLQTILSMKHSFIMDLYDKDHNPAGYVEIAARYRN